MVGVAIVVVEVWLWVFSVVGVVMVGMLVGKKSWLWLVWSG